MRAIKFRAWSTAKGAWIYSTEIEETLEIDAQVNPDGHGIFGIYTGPFGCDVVLIQFTGLHDRNGKEIYEGDVVTTPNGNWGVIQYEAPFFGLTVSADQVSHYRRDWMESCEIIGNSYENPELLEATK